MYTNEEMDGQSVKFDTNEETRETKEGEDRTHTHEESSENCEEIAGRG